MTTRLAERYERLLDAYPEGYRAERGPEILGTLLEGARPDQRWPSAREALGLVAGGVRTRLAQRSPSFRALGYGVVHLLVLLLLMPEVYTLVSATFGSYRSYEYEYGLADVSPMVVQILTVLGVAGLGAVLVRWYRVALAAVTALVVLELVVLGRATPSPELGNGLFANLAIDAVLLGLLTVLAVRPPPRALRPPRVWTAVVLAFALMAPHAVPLVPQVFGWDLLFGLGILASLLLGLFDLRVPAAGSLYLLGSGAFTVATQSVSVLGYFVPILASALLLAAGSLLGQRMVVRL